MPTGYTYGIYDGSQTVKDFIAGCSRAFGFMIAYRDEPLNMPLPDKIGDTGSKDKSYSEEQIERSREEIRLLKSMTPKELQDECDKDYEKEIERFHNGKKEVETRLARYREALEKIKQWTPEPKIAFVKSFAIEQLTQSIESDCMTSLKYTYAKEPEKEEPAEWLRYKLGRAESDLQYWEKQYKEDTARNEESNELLQLLKKELTKFDEP